MRRGALGFLLALFLLPGAALGAASLGMAGASTLLRVSGAESGNPASAAYSMRRWFTPFSIGAQFGNDSYSLRDYRRWNGAVWTDADKRELLARIGGKSLRGEASSDLRLLGVGGRGWSAGLRTVAAASGEVPREWAELALYGNAPNRRYELSGVDGQAIAYSELSLTRAAVRGERWFTPWLRRIGLLEHDDRGIAFGASLDLIRGWGYADVTRSEGELSTTIDAVNGHGLVHSRTAEGGSGVGLDLGLIARGGSWSAGLHARHLPAWIWWSDHAQFHSSEVTADSLTLNDSGENDLIDQTTESRPTAPFRRALPPSLTLSIARRRERWHLEFDLTQGLSRGAEINTTPRAALGAAYRAGKVVELRGGVAAGGLERALLAAGLGLTFGSVDIGLGLQSIGSFQIFEPRGVGAGLGVTVLK